MSHLNNKKSKVFNNILLGLVVAASGASSEARMGSGMGGFSHGGTIHQSQGSSIKSGTPRSSPGIESRNSTRSMSNSKPNLSSQQSISSHSKAAPGRSSSINSSPSRRTSPATRDSKAARNITSRKSQTNFKMSKGDDVALRSSRRPVMSESRFIAGDRDEHRNFGHQNRDFHNDAHFQNFRHRDFDDFHRNNFNDFHHRDFASFRHHGNHFFDNDFFFRHHHSHAFVDYIFVPIGGYWPGYYSGYCWSCYDNMNYPLADYTYNYNYYSPGATDYYAGSNLTYAPDQSQASDLFDLGTAAFGKGDYATAVDNLRKAVRLAPNDTVMPFAYAQALVATNQYEQASAVIATTLAQMTPYKPEITFPAGMYNDQNILISQVDNLKRAVLMDPANANLQLLYGYELMGLGKLDDARTALIVAKTNVNTAAPATALMSVLDNTPPQ